MKNQDYRLHTQRKNNQSLSSVDSSTPVPGIFESRPFVVQQKQQGSSQQSDLKASLMGAERYGHHLARIKPAGISTTNELTHVVQEKGGTVDISPYTQEDFQTPIERIPQSAEGVSVHQGKADLTVMPNTARNGMVVQMAKRKKENDDEDYQPYKKKQKRWTFSELLRKLVYDRTAHKRKRGNSKYDAIYACKACRRPLGGVTKKGVFEVANYKFLSKNKETFKSQQSGALDHHPAWAGRHDALVKANATHDQLRQDHDDPSRLRAMCKKCNESHKHEGAEVSDYESDSHDSGYMTPDDEPLNKGNYKDFRYDKDDDPSAGGEIKT